MAIACFRLLTFRPDPLFSVPFFLRCIADFTFFEADMPYLAMVSPCAGALRQSRVLVAFRLVALAGLVVFRRCGIELPAMAISPFELALAAERLGVLVGDADCLANLFDHALIRRGTVAARSFVAHGVRGLDVGIDITA